MLVYLHCFERWRKDSRPCESDSQTTRDIYYSIVSIYVPETTKFKMIRGSSATPSFSPNISSTNSSENVVPPCTCNWTRRFVDKFGIRYECKTPTNIVTEHMSAVSYNLFPQEVDNLEKLSDILGCLYNFNHGSLFDINHRGLNFFTPNEEQLREEVTIKEIDL